MIRFRNLNDVSAGGRRFRKFKEKFEITELSKQKNRMVHLPMASTLSQSDVAL